MGMKTVAVIPAFNEEKRIGDVVRLTKRHVDAVLVVDDGSSDGTLAAARKAGAGVMRLPRNMGAGFATRKGADFAIDGMKAKRLVFLDADGQHNPDDIPKLLKKLDEKFDVAFTFRRHGKMPTVKRFGNWWLTFSTKLLSGVNASDSQSGFKAMTAAAFRKMELKSERYEICSEIVIEAGRKRLSYCEIPIETRSASSAKKGTGIRDGVKVFVKMVGLKLRS